MNQTGRQVCRRVQGVFFTALSVFLFAAPGSIGAASTPTIDETKPATIPADIVADWKAQDGTNYASAITAMKTAYPKFADKFTGSTEADYLTACHWRRVARMKDFTPELKKMIYARHHDIGGQIIGYTEDMNSDGVKGLGQWGMTMSKSSDYQKGNSGGTAIHQLEFTDYYPKPTDLIADKTGCLRDPCPSFDGKKIVFAWSKDNNGYSLFDLDISTSGATPRQLTNDPDGIKVSDMEPCVTSSGDIVFCSSRCFQNVDCNMNLVSNLYIINKDGKYLRRIGYDQVNVFNPTMRQDGSLMYTRWEYNDRNVANCFPIMTMQQDGSRQTEFFGNQTSWPATFCQAREIPKNPMKALAVIGGHMGPYAGDLVLVNAELGRNGSKCVQLIAPKRTSTTTGSSFNMDGVPDADKLFQNPYPLDDQWFLISYRKTRSSRFSIYLMNLEGNRELIASGGTQSVSQPVSLLPRQKPMIPAYQADYARDTAFVSVTDVYYGLGTGDKVTKGSVKKLRVCGMEYRTDPPFGNTGSQSYQMGPVGRFGGTWEAKWVVGEVDVNADGSAAFQVPPNTPLFIQLIDADGYCVQTMRSWMTLMPGERYDCNGCHEDKNKAALSGSVTKKNYLPLKPLADVGQKRGSFHFNTVVQPVLDKNCATAGCHDASHASLNLKGEKFWTNDLDDADNKSAYRYWTKSYYNLSNTKKYVNCNAVFGQAEGVSPKSIGSPRSSFLTKIKGGHKDVKLTADEFGKLCAWVDLGIPFSGTYTDDMKETDLANYQKQLQRRVKEEAVEAKNIAEFIKDGGYKQADYTGNIAAVDPDGRGTAVSGKMVIGQFRARFIANERMLSFNLPSEGQVKLLDLMGRQILVQEISRDAFVQSAAQSVKLTVPAGTYIVKFKGVKVNSEQVVSVL